MRLINIETLKFDEFLGESIPPYCILSHRWGGSEVSYKHYYKQAHRDGPYRDTPGYQKIFSFCQKVKSRNESEFEPYPLEQRRSWKHDSDNSESESGAEPELTGIVDRVRWAWVDTCCIDKRSSAELSEAINSMFLWYKSSTECYVYLEDVGLQSNGQSLEAEVRTSSWFKRGWTLQELIAPCLVIFFDSGWRTLGHKCTTSVRVRMVDSDNACAECGRKTAAYGPCLTGMISEITQIDTTTLSTGLRMRGPGIPSVAQRMSWAAGRETTRVEDQAYCLLGLFDINMPLLYGEGTKAFRRLQLEIIQHWNDQSIFAWKRRFKSSRKIAGHSVLAERPGDFAQSGNIRSFRGDITRPVQVDTVTREGVHLHGSCFSALWEEAVPALLHSEEMSTQVSHLPALEKVYFLGLNCDAMIRGAREPVQLILRKVGTRYLRILCNSLGEEFDEIELTAVQEVQLVVPLNAQGYRNFRISV